MLFCYIGDEESLQYWIQWNLNHPLKLCTYLAEHNVLLSQDVIIDNPRLDQ